jgi:hypothetical protein
VSSICCSSLQSWRGTRRGHRMWGHRRHCAAAPLPPHLLDRRRLGLVVLHLHIVATSARRRLAPLTPRPALGPSRVLAPRVSAFCRTPKLRPRYCHHVPASRATAFHRNSSCACRCSACRTQHCLLVPMRSLCSGRSTPAHTANSRAPPRACLRHSLGTAHEPLLCRCRARLLPHPRAWATPRVTAHSGLLASARVSHLLRSHASCTPLLAQGRSHPAYPCRNRTQPQRFSSARVPPRRELRPSAAWFACRSRVCSTPPTRPRSARASRSEPLCRQSFAILLRPSPAPSPGTVSVLQRHHAPLLGSASARLLSPALGPHQPSHPRALRLLLLRHQPARATVRTRRSPPLRPTRTSPAAARTWPSRTRPTCRSGPAAPRACISSPALPGARPSLTSSAWGRARPERSRPLAQAPPRLLPCPPWATAVACCCGCYCLC